MKNRNKNGTSVVHAGAAFKETEQVMKKRCDIPSRSSYMRRLRTFLEERHPTLRYAEDMIRTRSEKARFTFLHKLDEGYSPVSVRKAADAVLFEGLIFSKFDTVRCILATEFPVIPPH